MLFVFPSLRFLCWTVPHQDLVLKFVLNLQSVHVIKTFRLIKKYSYQWNQHEDFFLIFSVDLQVNIFLMKKQQTSTYSQYI